MLYSQLYKHICMQNHNNETIKKTSDTVLRKKYTSHFIERFVCERELETEQNCNILTSPLLWPSELCLSRSPGLLNRRPSSLLGAGFLYRILSPKTGLVSKLNRGSRGSLLPGAVFLYASSLQNSPISKHWISCALCYITVHSLLVHQSVTVPWNFNPVPHCQLSSPTPMEYALPPSLEWHVWRGRGSIYNTKTQEDFRYE